MKRITPTTAVIAIIIICLMIIFFSAEDCDECFSASVMVVKFFISGWVIIIGSIYFTRKFLITESIIFDIESQPIFRINEAVDGVPFAGEGIIESDKIIESPYTKTPCVYFHAIKEEYIKGGKYTQWRVVENIALFIPFHIKDEKGRLKIDLTNFDDDFSKYKIPLQNRDVPNPANSEIDCEATLDRQPYEKRYRRSEFVLRPDTKVFVYGMVSKKNAGLVLHEDERYPLIISKKNRDQYVEEFYQGGNLVYLIHFLIAIGYTIVLFSANYFFRLNLNSILILFFIGNSIIAGSVIFSLYNRIITLKQRVLNSLSNIDVELKRRVNLIPNLVEVVKGYVKYEREIQQILAETRTKIIFSKEQITEVKPIIPSLVAVIENYPDLKVSENFLSLMQALIDTEERIAYSREFYNRSVRKYNTLISQFPFLLISIPLGMKELDFISITRGKELTP